MLRGDPEPQDLMAQRQSLLPLIAADLQAFEERFGRGEAQSLPDVIVTEISYPVLEYPKKVTSHNLDKKATLEGTLLGIKGQYLIFDVGVINMRKFAGYHLSVESG
jgi:hypothetical protein